MIVSAHQPHFMPWIGYINRIYLADVFVLTDNMQFTRFNYINRIRLRGKKEEILISVPLEHTNWEEKFQSIQEITISYKKEWISKLLKTVEMNYQSQPFFNDFFPTLQGVIQSKHAHILSLDIDLLRSILKYLEIDTPILMASENKIGGVKEDELFRTMLTQTACDTVLLGLGASKNYIDKEALENEGFKVATQLFTHPEYKQKGSDFIKGLSVIDLIFNVSKDEAIHLIKNAGSVTL